VTNTPGPVLLDGIPDDIAAILAVPADRRESAQQAALLDYYRGIDGQLRKHTAAVAAAKRPRPIDPRLKQLRDALAEAEQPLPVDPKLARLRQDVELSAAQAANPRLTAAQDIAWALVNSSAFLFNH
jgi:hypothetical protein